MTIWNAEKQVAFKCDLCLNTPYWSEQGGPFGKQACVETCPTKVRVFGDLDDPESEAAGLARKHATGKKKEEAGTSPNLLYILD